MGTHVATVFCVAEYNKTWPTKRGHYVYRFWGYDGTSLYVGCAGERVPVRVSSRIGDHRRQQPWWPEVDEARTDVAIFGSAAEVVEEEPRQIAALSPKYNQVLLGHCGKGHDISAPGARTTEGRCKECMAEYEVSPARKASKAAYAESARGKAMQAKRNADPAKRARKRAYDRDPLTKARHAANVRARASRPIPGQIALLP